MIKLKTFVLLSLDCRKKENAEKVNKALMKIKPIQKRCKDENKLVDIELLEDFVEKMCRKYDVKPQSIMPSYLDNESRWYSLSFITRKKHEWLDTTHAYSMWELFAKASIMLYVMIKQEKVNIYKEEEEKE